MTTRMRRTGRTWVAAPAVPDAHGRAAGAASDARGRRGTTPISRHHITSGIGIMAVAALLAAGCGNDGREADTPASTPSEEAVAPATEEDLTVVALGDSWPAGGHCAGCRTFMGRYADDLQTVTGTSVNFVDLTHSVVPGTGRGVTSESMLADLQETADVREKVEAADVIVIHAGLNDLQYNGLLEELEAGTCGADGADCIRRQGQDWRQSFDAILVEIEQLRQGRPTAVRLVTAQNVFGHTSGKPITDELANAMCDAAAQHAVLCIDARPILNGPTLDRPVDENAPESHQALADALVASGLDELGETVASDDEQVLPDGTYRTPPLTRADIVSTLRSAGVADADIQGLEVATTADEPLVFSLLVDGDRWQFASTQGQGSPVVLNERTYRPVDIDTITASDANNTVTFDYQLDGDTLTISVVAVAGDQSSASLPLLIALYQTAPFTRA